MKETENTDLTGQNGPVYVYDLKETAAKAAETTDDGAAPTAGAGCCSSSCASGCASGCAADAAAEAAAPQKKASVLAILSAFFGLAGLFFSSLFGVVGLVMGVIDMKNDKPNPLNIMGVLFGAICTLFMVFVAARSIVGA